MIKPEDIPQDIWDAALAVAWEIDSTDDVRVVEPIARAIMEEREACAQYVRQQNTWTSRAEIANGIMSGQR